MDNRKPDIKFNIYNMELHEHRSVSGGDMFVLRVPNGWVYYSYDGELQETTNMVFVPFHAEFNQKAELEKTYGKTVDHFDNIRRIVDHFDDIKRIVGIFERNDISISYDSAKRLWKSYSGDYKSNWLSLPKDDTSVYAILMKYYEATQ